jgi:transcriptional regulator with XRE-family HTH domain
MNFGRQVRELRRAKSLSQRALAAKVGVTFGYISKIENDSLDFGDYPSDDLIRKLAKALDADLGDLFLLAERIPDEIRERVLQRPDAFRKLAALDDASLDEVIQHVDRRHNASC